MAELVRGYLRIKYEKKPTVFATVGGDEHDLTKSTYVMCGRSWPIQFDLALNATKINFTGRLNWLGTICSKRADGVLYNFVRGKFKEHMSGTELVIKCIYQKEECIWQKREPTKLYGNKEFFEDMLKDLEEYKKIFKEARYHDVYKQLVSFVNGLIYVFS